jgi:predicted nucleotide-binding protein
MTTPDVDDLLLGNITSSISQAFQVVRRILVFNEQPSLVLVVDEGRVAFEQLAAVWTAWQAEAEMSDLLPPPVLEDLATVHRAAAETAYEHPDLEQMLANLEAMARAAVHFTRDALSYSEDVVDGHPLSAVLANHEWPMHLWDAVNTVDDVATSVARSRVSLTATTQEELPEDDQTTPSTIAVAHRVFIGHGQASDWRELKEFLVEKLHLEVDHFERVSTAGTATIDRLEEMLDACSFGFVLLTAEDEQLDGTKTARPNCIHEAGAVLGKYGRKRGIVLLDEACEEFSNIMGLGQIRFPAGHIRYKFQDVREVLEREGLVP